MVKYWYRGKWRVSKEVVPIIMEMLNVLTKRGLEIRAESEICEFFSYHPARMWEKEKRVIEEKIILISALFSDVSIDCEWERFAEENWQSNWRQYFRLQ
jgi:hypothetical protein